MKATSVVTALLAINLAIASGQGYGNVEDDSDSSTPQKTIPPSQQISSLPQYESDPAISSDYGQPPNSNLQSNPNPPAADQSQSQDYWWMNQNAFQKPPGHPGVEQLGQSSPPAPQAQSKPTGNRNPNAYNPPTQNSYQQPQKPQPAPYKPQNNNNNQFQQSSPSFGSPSNPSSSGFGWQGQAPAPSQPSGFNAPAPPPQGGPPPAAPNNFQPQQQPFNLPSQGYNPPPKAPQQQPPQVQPQPYQPLPLSPQSPPPGFYQPPPQTPQEPVNPYETRPQNFPPSNQNNQPQYQPDSQPATSFQLGPRPNNYQNNQPYQAPAPQQQQQQYNKPSPQQAPSRPFNNGQQFQNNAQGITPNNNNQQQQPQNYDDQLPYPGCPAAMLCVSEDRCNLIGIIEESPIGLSEAEKAHRVALSRCSEPSTGVEGVCCRDPNYKDPWPDMNGGGGGGNHHHHEDKGQPQSSGQGQSPTAYQPNFQSQNQPQQPANNFRNPYAALRRNITTQRQSHKTQFETCTFGEACVIAYKCHEGFLKSSQDKKPIEHDKGDNKNLKKCKEDIFKNAFVCCKIDHANNNIITPSTPLSTTFRPTTTTKSSIFLPSAAPTKDTIYKNNYLLTNTLTPSSTSEPELTESSLITGLGLRFHSHLHTKSAIRANEAKPNPYTGGQRAIIPLYSEASDDQVLINNRSTTVGNFSDASSNSIELLQSASNTKTTNQTAILIIREKMTNSTYSVQKPMNSTAEIYTKPDVNKIPEPVPLTEEYSTYPPSGFIFKGDDLYIPELIIPSQNFLPPSIEYGEMKKEIVKEEGETTEYDLIETTTMSDANSLG